MASNILITGFEAFGGFDINPSIEAAKKLPVKFSSYNIQVEEIPLRYDIIKNTIESLIDKHQPSFLIMTGQAPRATVCLEKVAINYAHVKKTAYNCGAKPQHETLEKDGPSAYFSTLPIVALKDALTEEKIPATISLSAGAFGCNQIFYDGMNYITINKIKCLAGFVHVPLIPKQTLEKPQASMSLEMITKAYLTIISSLVEK
ncbi:MAG: pyroglutamyl-peptidase I [Candidatus Heimdallarchaeota archaeon]|nr:pyroglutamyl-peptidase I [Candidatus Heimdallarchaeota archaeon]MCK5049095.1 pyroglutamyl-peptidase I [Candidatus Heimdallarchaeota archaeon]